MKSATKLAPKRAALAAADDRVLVEVWNQNVMTPSDRVGRCELSVAAITADPQPFQLPLDTGGEVAIRARVADSAPAVPRSGGHTLGGAVGLAMAEPPAGGGPAAGQSWAQWVASGAWEVDVGGTRFPAVASLRPLYDPKNERIRM